MKTVAIIDEFERVDEAKREQIRQIRDLTGADYVAAVMSGNYLQRGVPAEESKHIRAQKAVEAGVDAVFERPVFTVLSGLDTYVPSGIALLEKLNGIDELCIPSGIDEPDLVNRLTLYLFAEGKEYQDQIRRLRGKGLDYYEAQAAVLEGEFSGSYPEIGQEMRKPVNYAAFECLKSLKRMYSSIKPALLPEDFFDNRVTGSAQDGDMLQKIFPFIKYEMLLISEKMTQIYGGSTVLAKQLLAHIEQYDDCGQFVQAVGTQEHSQENIHRFLLCMLLGIGKSDIAMSRMYDSAPYARLLASSAGSSAFLADLKAGSRIPVITDIKKEYASLDATCRSLLDIDIRASKIYKAFKTSSRGFP